MSEIRLNNAMCSELHCSSPFPIFPYVITMLPMIVPARLPRPEFPTNPTYPSDNMNRLFSTTSELLITANDVKVTCSKVHLPQIP